MEFFDYFFVWYCSSLTSDECLDSASYDREVAVAILGSLGGGRVALIGTVGTVIVVNCSFLSKKERDGKRVRGLCQEF